MFLCMCACVVIKTESHNWPRWRKQVSVECSAVSGTFIVQPFPQRLRGTSAKIKNLHCRSQRSRKTRAKVCF